MKSYFYAVVNVLTKRLRLCIGQTAVKATMPSSEKSNHPVKILYKAAPGQDLYYHRIRESGLAWNYKCVRRVPARVKAPLQIPAGPMQAWSMDFMHDVLSNKRKFGILNIIDDYNREAIIDCEANLLFNRLILNLCK